MTQTLNIKNTLLIGFGLLLVISGLMLYSKPFKAKANIPTSPVIAYLPSATIATTSPQYMRQGSTIATSTLYMTTDGNSAVQFNIIVDSSTTLPTLNYRYEYSSNYNVYTGNGDWYAETATSTSQGTLGQDQSYQWNATASSTAGTAYTTATDTFWYIRTPSKPISSIFTRTVFWLPASAPKINLKVEAVGSSEQQ